MIEWFEIAVKPHWPFIMAAVVFMVIGQVMKGSVFTRARAYAVYKDQLPSHVSHLPGARRERRKGRWFWWWSYKTLPLHPVAAGIVLGLLLPEPEPGITGFSAMLYFAGAGSLSVFLYQVIKGIAKRQKLDLLPLPGQSGGHEIRVSNIPSQQAIPSPPKVPQALLDELEHDERPTNPPRGK